MMLTLTEKKKKRKREISNRSDIASEDFVTGRIKILKKECSVYFCQT